MFLILLAPTWLRGLGLATCLVGVVAVCLGCAPITPQQAAAATLSRDAARLDAGAIYRQVAPAVAFIETSAGTGSGLLLENGYVVTNAHVVWPYNKARVVFGNGDEFLQTPVINVDHHVDLALLGPIDANSPGLPLVDGEGLSIGEEVYLIGYPGETERFPQPALARGLISRMRQWNSQEITYFQTDAAIAGGQSGGVLVSTAGHVIGLSGFTFADGAFGLAASVADLAPLIERLAAGEDTDDLKQRGLLQQGNRLRHTFSPEHAYDQRMYIILGEEGREVKVQARSEADIFLAVMNVYGDVIAHEDAEEQGREKSSFVVEAPDPYFLIVGPVGPPRGENVVVSGSQRLQPFDDPDDGRRVAAPGSIAGQIDYPGDVDVFFIRLNALKPVTITVDSIVIDAYLTVERATTASGKNTGPASRSDDDNGGGLFGLNAQLHFTPAASADYVIVVEDSYHSDVGGYRILVEEEP